VPVLSVADVTKTIAFGAPYTSSDFAAQLDTLHGKSVVIDGLQVVPVPGSPGSVFVFPGRALVRGIIVELTATPVLVVPGLTPPFALYLDTVDEDPGSATTLDFALPGAIPAGAALVRQWSENGLLVEGRPETLLGRSRGVKQRRILRSSGQTVFNLEGLSFEPVTDQLLVWADGSKRALEPGFDGTIDGLRSLTLASVLADGLNLDVLVHSGVRFRQAITAFTGTIVNLPPGTSYTPTLSDLLVFKNGLLLRPTVDYIEGSSVLISLTVPAVPADILELYGVDGMIFRSTTTLAAASSVNLAFHAYRPGTNSIQVFLDGLRLEPVFDYVETNGEQLTFPAPITGVLHTVIMHSTISPTDVTRELGEFFDIGRDLADAINDPDGNRTSVDPPSAENPLATIFDITTNQEVIDARGSFPNLNDRITSGVSGTGVLVTHGALHAENGTDPVPVATPTVGGLMSAADKVILDGHIGFRGEAQHAVALGDPTPTAGFLSGADKVKLDAINPLLLPKAVWGIRFYTDTNQVIDPQLLSGQQKGGITFLEPTRDGTVPAFSPTNTEPFSLTIRFTMTVTVTAATTIFVSLSQVLMAGLKVFVDGAPQALPFVGSRVEGTYPLTIGTRRIDYVGYGGGGGPVAGTRFAFNTNLLGVGKPVTWLSTP
jgi:hypothetical protein